MLKNILLGAVILMGLISGVFAGNYTIPSGYSYIKSVGGGALKVYHKNGVYVSVIDLGRAKINVGNVDKANNNEFTYEKINEWWNDVANWKTLGMYNGQFFNYRRTFYSSTTTLSFPLRSYWNNINTSVDYGQFKTLRVNSWGYTTIHSGYSTGMLNNSKELIVGLNFYTNKGYYNSTGRFYIGGIPFNKSETREYYRTMEYLLFFTVISKTQIYMNSEISKWNVMQRDIVMMDGSGSAQMKVGSLKKGGNRVLPNVITMKKTLILFLLFLISCNTIELNNDIKNKKEDIKKEEVNSPYTKKKIQTYSGEIKIRQEKKEFGIYVIEGESSEKEKYLEVHNFSDEKYKEFEKYKELDSFRLSIYSLNGKKGIEKTLFFIKDNFFKKEGKHEFLLEDYKFDFTKKEIEIFSKMNISNLGFIGIGAGTDNTLETEGDITKYKEDVKIFDNNMKYILNNSKTLNKIIVLDYKIFTKKDGKIKVEDIRMNKKILRKKGL